MTLTRTLSFACVILFASHALANDPPPLEAYGRLPMYDLYELSPSGKLAAARVTFEDKDLITIVDVDNLKRLVGATAERVSPRRLKFVEFQPQYRGSDGFGHDHLVAGEGEYGGYAALAAGAFSSDMYRCIVSIAGVSDIPKKMSRARSTRGSDDWGIDFWEGLYGVEVSEKDILRSISPAYHAESFQAPVLLLHGVRDTRVNVGQSTRMYRALRKAGKDVTFIKLQGEDHWLTKEETRIEALQATAEFIEQHL